MSSFMLLIWISLIVILNVRSELQTENASVEETPSQDMVPMLESSAAPGIDNYTNIVNNTVDYDNIDRQTLESNNGSITEKILDTDDIPQADEVTEENVQTSSEVEKNKIDIMTTVETILTDNVNIETKNQPNDNKTILEIQKCFDCVSTIDTDCFNKPTKEINCKTTSATGCFTHFKAQTNITTRGCVSDLTATDVNFCKSNKKLCMFCYDQGCNNLLAPSIANHILTFKLSNLAFLLLGLLYYL